MQRPKPETISLNDILITEELWQRAPRPPNWQAQAEAMQALAQQMARDSESLLQSLVDTALELCAAGTTGVSLLETAPDGAEIFRWTALAGTLAHHVGGSTPRNFSPCGVCLDQGSPVLFSHPERYFTYFQDADTPIVEGLVLPLIADSHVFGTIWIMSHDQQQQFDSEDVRVMTSLADLTATALLLQQCQTRELLAANVVLEREILERKRVEEQTHALIANLPGGVVFVVDRNLRYLLAEGEALTIAGFKPEDFVGHSIFEVPSPELATQYEVNYRKALAGEPFEYEHSAHDHTYISRGIPLRAENGEIYAVLVVFYDITDRKHGEKALLESEARLQSIANLVPDLLWDSEPNGSTNWYNQRWMEYTGQTFEQAIGWGWIDAIHPDDREGSAQRYREAVEQGVMLQQEHRIRRHDGEYRWFAVNAFPLKDENGKVVKMYGAATDIHEARISLAALQESEAKYRSLFESIDEGFCVIELIDDEAGEVVDYRFLEGNPAFEQLTGLKNTVGKLGSEIAPKTESYWLEAYDQVVRTGEPLRIENYNEDTGRWYSAYASRVGGAGSRQVAIVFDDITERKQAEEQLRRAAEMDAFRVKLTDALRSVSDPLEIQRAAMRIVGESLQVDRVLYGDITPDGKMWIARDNYTSGRLPKLIGSFPTASFSTSVETLKRGEVVIIPNVENATDLTEAEKALYEATNTRSALGVPLIKGGCWLSNIGIHHAEPRHWTAAEIALVQETADRTWETMERARAEAVVEEDLRDTQMLHNLATRLIFEDDRQAIYQEIVKTAIALTQADAGSFQFLDQTTQELVLIATQGIDRTLTEHFYRLDASSNTSCGVALATGERTFINFDVPESEDPDGSLRMHRDAGLRCVQSTPLLSRSGKPIGMVSTHWREDHQLSDRELRFLDLLARQAADIIEQRQAEENRIQLIYEQAAREQERQRAETLAELDQAKTLFFSNVSHEFRAPLTLILAPLKDALADLEQEVSKRIDEHESIQLCESLKEQLQITYRNGLRLLKLVNTLLDFSRIEAGRMEAIYAPTDLAMFTTELASVFRSAIERAGLQLVVNCPPLPEPVYVDREMWEKIVLNLLSNAFKFTFEGEIRVSLRPVDDFGLPILDFGFENREASTTSSPDPKPENLKSKIQNPKSVVLQIQDTGTGIAPEHLPHLFERFYQVRGTQARTHEGSGIGLALIHELVRLHGGTIEVHSTLGEGTCFTIALPFGTDHLSNDRIASENHLLADDHLQPIPTLASTTMRTSSYVEAAKRWPMDDFGLPILDFGLESSDTVSPNIDSDKPTQNPKSKILSGMPDRAINPKSKIQNPKSKILLVDDNADMREYLTRILGEQAQVEAVADGATALTITQERVPDLILSDVMMPGLDGFELLQALRANPRTREVPIILLSARAGEEAIVEGLKAGADDYLVKPFSAQELVSRVTAHLQMAQLRREALQDARRTIRSRDEFISVVSHELNTPLVAILGWTRLLRSNPPSSAILSKALDTIERNATLQANLVQDLLDMSRITAGKLRLHLQPIELTSVIEMAVATVNHLAEAKGIDLTWWGNTSPINQGDTVIVRGDRNRLQQVISNLLINAIKFTPELGNVSVELSVVDNANSAGGAAAEIRVTDTGIGIAADFLPYVFDRFRQADGPNSVKGLGLGLAIARHLVELHDGTIRAESAGEGQGATFIVRLPLQNS